MRKFIYRHREDEKKREDIDERGKRILVFVVGSIGDGV